MKEYFKSKIAFNKNEVENTAMYLNMFGNVHKKCINMNSINQPGDHINTM